MRRWSPLFALVVAATVFAAEPPPNTEIDPDARLAADQPEVDYGRLGPQPLGSDDLLALKTRWEGAGQLRLSSVSYWAEDTVLNDGVCSSTMRKGILIPILSGGKGGVPERKVGVVFVGEGEVALRFPERASAWTFANHMVLKGAAKKPEMAPIAHQKTPFTTPLSRAVVFSADPVIDVLLKGLDPVGGGMVERATEEGIDAEMVVTSDRGELKARAIARELLAERRDELLRSGLDPVEMLRFDRMVNEELGTPGDKIRLIADYRTDTRFHVASGDGGTLGAKGYDRWLTCYRDGTDHRDTGLRATAFAHGTDPAGVRHLSQFSGEAFPADAPGAPSQAQTRIESVRAHVDVELSAERNLNELGAVVKSKLVLRAREEGVRHVIMRLPRHEALDRTFALDRVAMPDGTPVGWLELDGGLPRSIDDRYDPGAAADAMRNLSSGGSTGSSGGAGGMSGPSGVAAPTDASGGSLASQKLAEPSVGTIELLNRRMERRQEILVVLARPLRYGEEVELLVDWRARWPFSNWASVKGGATGEVSANLGSTTGQRTLVPELLPTLGGTAWDFTAKVSLPPRRLDLALTGQTTDERMDEGGWMITRSEARGVRRPSLAVGRWKTQVDVPAAGLPGVRVHVFANASNELAGLAPEVRRVLVFLRRFLPIPSAEEIDVYQSRGRTPQEAFSVAHEQASAGMVSFQKLATAVVNGAVSRLGDDPSNAMKAMVARQVAAQVWGQVVAPASERDAWLTAALSDTYGAYYVRAAMQEKGFEAFEDRIERVRKQMENPVDGRVGISNEARDFMSLTDGGGLYYANPSLFNDYAFFLFGRVLRERLGDYAYFRGLDRFARQHVGRRVTTAQLREALEAHTGTELKDFFDFWVHGGFIPKVEVQVRLAPMPGDPGANMLLGCVVSDVPFGRFDVPVVVMDQKKTRRVAALVDVEDGLGGFSVLRREGDVEVELDPQNQILAYSRKVRRVEKTDCEAQ
jgi:hypothetical protein